MFLRFDKITVFLKKFNFNSNHTNQSWQKCQWHWPETSESDDANFAAANCFCSWSTDLECDDLSAATVCLCTSCIDDSWCWCWSTVSDMLCLNSWQLVNHNVQYIAYIHYRPENKTLMSRIKQQITCIRQYHIVDWDHCVTPEWPRWTAHLHRSAGGRLLSERILLLGRPGGRFQERPGRRPRETLIRHEEFDVLECHSQAYLSDQTGCCTFW